MMKGNRILAALALVALVSSCGKDEINQPATPLTYPNLTQISVVSSQPVMNAIAARNSNAAKLSVHSNVYRTANPNDNIHYSILFYAIPSIDKNRAHLSIDSKQIVIRLDYNTNTGNLTAVQRLNERTLIQHTMGTATMNGNLITIQSLNLRHSNLRKFLNIPEVSHFQNEKSELQKELKSVETAKEDLLKESKNLVVVTRQIVELEKLRTEKLFNAEQISQIEQSLAEAKDIKKSTDSEINKINQRIANPNEIRERINSRLKALEKILAEDN